MGYRALKGNRINKKTIASIVLLLTVILLFILFFSLKDILFNSTVFTVNGEKVSKEEFTKAMSGLRGSTYSDFVQKYGEVDSVNFWTTSFNGEVPLEVLKNLTLEKLKRNKVEQILYKKYGLVEDISYSAFKEELKVENKRRKLAVSKKEPIYGPVQYDEKIYCDYLQGNRTEKLKLMLSKTDLLVSEEEIEKYYNENKEELFIKPIEKKVEKISISYLDQSGNPSTDLQAKAGDTMKKMIEMIKPDSKFDEIVSDYIEKSGLKIEYKEEIISGIASRDNQDVSIELSNLQKGQLSGVMDDKNSLSVFRVVEIMPSEFIPMGDVKSQIETTIIDQKYNEMLDKLVKEAKIKINQGLLKKISQ